MNNGKSIINFSIVEAFTIDSFTSLKYYTENLEGSKYYKGHFTNLHKIYKKIVLVLSNIFTHKNMLSIFLYLKTYLCHRYDFSQINNKN